MTTRTVMCAKLKKELPGLEKPPFPGEIGQKIYDSVSAEVWNAWKSDMQIKVLNEYRLNMGDPKDYQVLVDQMMLFIGLSTGDVMKVNDK